MIDLNPYRDTVIFDIDGVLCDNAQQLHDFMQDDPPHDRWDAEWFPNMGDHDLHVGWSIACRLMLSKSQIILFTNRPEWIRDITEAWLKKHQVVYDLLVMRPDDTPYSQGKRERLRVLIDTYNVVLAIDDDATQVKIFREAGVPVIHAYNGLDSTYSGTR